MQLTLDKFVFYMVGGFQYDKKHKKEHIDKLFASKKTADDQIWYYDALRIYEQAWSEGYYMYPPDILAESILSLIDDTAYGTVCVDWDTPIANKPRR